MILQPLTQPLDAIIFDCDGTLSEIEGIDELARNNNVGNEVAALTEEAMSRTGLTPELYQQRLDLVLPTEAQVNALGETYFEHKTPDILAVLQTFLAHGKHIYIVSAGLQKSVENFAALLGVNTDNVFAVDLSFDHAGNYLDFDRSSPMVFGDGKKKVVARLKEKHPEIAYVGDGLNDVAVIDLVTRFIGYGGSFYRENIKALSDFYITEKTMMPLLELCLTGDERM